MKLMLGWLISCVFLVSCAGIPIPDVPIGRPLDSMMVKRKDAFGIEVYDKRPNPNCMKAIGEAECGFYTWTVSDKVQYVGENPKTWLLGKPWSKLRLEALSLPSESMADIKGAFMNGCKKYGCNRPEIAKWRIKLDSFDTVVDQITKP